MGKRVFYYLPSLADGRFRESYCIMMVAFAKASANQCSPSLKLWLKHSGRWESPPEAGAPPAQNPVFFCRGAGNPRQRRVRLRRRTQSFFVGALGIEPSLHPPEGCILPAYSAPLSGAIGTLSVPPRFNLSEHTHSSKLLSICKSFAFLLVFWIQHP